MKVIKVNHELFKAANEIKERMEIAEEMMKTAAELKKQAQKDLWDTLTLGHPETEGWRRQYNYTDGEIKLLYPDDAFEELKRKLKDIDDDIPA